MNYSSDGVHSSPIKPPRKSQTPQTTKGRRKRTSIHEPVLDSNKRRTPRRKRITPSEDENDTTTQLLKDSEDSLLNITLSESDSDSLLLKKDDLSDSFIELSKEHNKNIFQLIKWQTITTNTDLLNHYMIIFNNILLMLLEYYQLSI